MGGLSLDVGHLHNGDSKARLTTKGLMALAKRGHFINVIQKAIIEAIQTASRNP